MKKSLQDLYATESICFGCGPANSSGLQIKSFVEGSRLVAHFKPKKQHRAFKNILSGGIIGCLLDCHCNWAASYHLMLHKGLSLPPCTVTAEYTIKLIHPTPSNGELKLIASLEKITHNRAHIVGELYYEDKLCDTCQGIFVAVNQGHPAYQRW